MSNEGIFLTKNGVELPAVLEMSVADWASYQNDLVLPVVKDTNHEYNVFEGWRFRGYINENVHAKFSFPGGDTEFNYTPEFLVGAGTVNASTGEVTPSVQPLQVRKADRIFLAGSVFKGEKLADGDNVAVRIESIDALSRIMMNVDTGALVFYKNNVDQSLITPATLDNDTVSLQIITDDDDIKFVEDIGDNVVYSLARTHTSTVLSGGIGVFSSSGTDTGDALPFGSTETLEAADLTVNGTMSVESSFGQITTYTVKLGASLSTDDTEVTLNFVAGQSGSHAISGDVDGGIGTKTYEALSSLPSGLSITSGGSLQGTPVSDATSVVNVKVTDEYGTEIIITYTIIVSPEANVNYTPQAGIVGTPYEYNPHINNIDAGGVVINSGTLPSGVLIDGDTAVLTGTPSMASSFSFQLAITRDGLTEIVDVVLPVYNPLTADFFENGSNSGTVEGGGHGTSFPTSESTTVSINPSEGSGQFQYSITGGNLIDSDGNISLFGTGVVTVTIVDLITGQVLSFNLLVAGQGDVAGMAIVEDDDDVSEGVSVVDILTDCQNPITIAFNAMQIIKGIETAGVPFREYPIFDEMEGASVSNNGKPFASFRSKADGGYAVASNGKDGRPFILEFVVDASVANSTFDMAVGVAKNWQTKSLPTIDFAVVITTVSGVRKVEIRKNNVYQTGSRFTIAEGQQVGFGVYPDKVELFIDGLLKYELTSNTFACTGLDIAFFATKANLVVGGKAGNLLFDIATVGTADEVGVIDTTTGLYTPSINNISLVRIEAISSVNSSVKYSANVRVIRGAAKTSLEHAMIEGIPVDVYIADRRLDILPLRLDREGRPDKNQFDNPQHLGTLGGSGKLASTPTRQDFRNDRGATSTSLTIDKVVFSGAFLAVRNMPLVKRLVPYMRESNANGVHSLKQLSTGCHKRVVVLMVWQTADCEDVPIFDAIEIKSGLSYTMFDLEVGQAVQSQLPISIEGFPDADGVLFEYSQFDRHYVRIGS